MTLVERALLPRPLDTERLIREAEVFHARFPEELPDLATEGKRSGRKYEEDFASAEACTTSPGKVTP